MDATDLLVFISHDPKGRKMSGSSLMSPEELAWNLHQFLRAVSVLSTDFLLRLHIIWQAEIMFSPSCAYPHEATPHHAIQPATFISKGSRRMQNTKALMQKLPAFHLRYFCCLDSLLMPLRKAWRFLLIDLCPGIKDVACIPSCSSLPSLLHRAGLAWQMLLHPVGRPVSNIMTHRQRITSTITVLLTQHRLTYITLFYRHL